MEHTIDPIKLGQTIKSLLKKHGMTQEQLANHLHITKSAVSQNLNGKSTFDIQNLILIAKLFDMTLDALLNLDQQKHVPSQYEKMVEKGLESIKHIKPSQLNLYQPDEYGKVFIDYVIEANHTVLFNYVMSENIKLFETFLPRAPDIILSIIIYKLESKQNDIIPLIDSMVDIKGRFIIEDALQEKIFFTYIKDEPLILQHLINTYLYEKQPRLFKKSNEKAYLISIRMFAEWIAKYDLTQLQDLMLKYLTLDEHLYDIVTPYVNHQQFDMLKYMIKHIYTLPPTGVKRLSLRLQECTRIIIQTREDDLIKLMLQKHLYDDINHVIDLILVDPWISILEWIYNHYQSSISFYRLDKHHLLKHKNILTLSMSYMSDIDKNRILASLTIKEFDLIDYFIEHGAMYTQEFQQPHTFRTIHYYIKAIKNKGV